MENVLRHRLVLGIAAVAVLAGLCAAAVWSVRDRLHAPPVPVAAATAAPDPGLLAENRRLRSEVARLAAERDAALATVRSIQTQLAGVPAQIPPAAEPERRAPSPPSQAPASNAFAEPQTFSSASTHQ